MATSKDALLAELDAIHEAKLRALRTGQSVSIPGSGTQITAVSYSQLCVREREIRHRLLMAGGAYDRVRPNIQTDTGTSTDWRDA